MCVRHPDATAEAALIVRAHAHVAGVDDGDGNMDRMLGYQRRSEDVYGFENAGAGGRPDLDINRDSCSLW